MLRDVYNSYKCLADKINWKKYSANELFFECIRHENDELAENFYAGIICRYWGYAGRVYTQCNRHIPFDQCYDVLIDTINYVLMKRVWENKSSSLYNDKNGPDKAFHIVLKRQRSILLSKLTAQKRKTNFNTLSIDEIHEKYNDAAEGLFELSDKNLEDITLIEFIKYKKEPLDIIILDKICFSNWRSLKNVANDIKNIDVSSFNYYNECYNISYNDFKNLNTRLKRVSGAVIMSEIKKLLYMTKKEMLAVERR